MVHAHHCYPYLSTTAPKTTTCQGAKNNFVLSGFFLSKSCFPPKKQYFRAKSAGVEEKKNPASSEQNAGNPEHALTVLSSRSKLRQRCLLVYIHLIQVNLPRGAEVLTIHCQHRPCPMREPVAGGVRICTEFFYCVIESAGAKGIDFC